MPTMNRLGHRHFHSFAFAALALASSLTFAGPGGRYYDDAVDRYGKGDLPGAVVQLKNALKEEPKMLAAHLLLGKALLRTGEIKAAEASLEQAQTLGVNRAEIVVPLGRVYLLLGENKKLIDVIGTSDLPKDTLAEVLTLRGSAYAMLGNRTLAGQSFELAREAAPKSAAPLMGEAMLKLRAGDLTAAKTSATRATELEPGLAAAWATLGLVLRGTGDTKAALTAFDRALALDKGQIEARITKTALLLQEGRDREASAVLDVLKEGGLVDPRASYLLATIAVRKGDSKAAKQAYSDVVDQVDVLPKGVVSGDETVLLAAALSHQALGNPEKAREYLKDLLTLAPRHYAGQLILSTLSIDSRDFGLAQPMLDGLLREAPNDPAVLSALGSLHLARKNYQLASDYFEKSMSKTPNAQTLRDLGLSQLGLGNDKRGTELLEAALAKNPQDIGTMARLSMLYGRQEQPDKALKMAEAAVRADPGNLTMHNFLGNMRGRLGNKKGAREAFESILRLDPKFTPAAINLSWLDIEEKRFDAARTRLTQLVKENNTDAGLAFQLGVLEYRAGRFDQALQHWERSMSLRPSDPKPGLAMIEALRKQGDLPKALSVAKSLGAQHGSDINVLVAIGQTHLAAGETQRARGAYRDAARLAEFDPERLVMLGRLQLAAGGIGEAVYNAQKALQARPNDLGAMALQVEIEFRRGDRAKADAALKALNARYPNELLTQLVNGHAALGNGQFGRAVEAYRTVFNRSPSTPNAILLAQGLLASGQAAAAVTVLMDWSKRQPGDITAMLALAEVQSEAGQTAESKATFARLVQLDDGNASLWIKYANALLKAGDAGARPAAEKAVKLAPSSADALSTMGVVLINQGQIEAGVHQLREARLRAPSSAELRVRLAAGLTRLARTQEAKDELKAALRLAPELAKRPDIQALIRQLGLAAI
jgi:putative PEP-CTERM system TPR-repeat lipoprotein